MYLHGCNSCLNGLGMDYMSMMESIGSAMGKGGSGGGSGSGGGTQATTVTSSVTTNVSPQISPQFIQQQSPVNSGVNAGINPMPGMGAPATGMLPGFDLFPQSFQQAGMSPLFVAAGIGLLVLVGIKVARSRKLSKST